MSFVCNSGVCCPICEGMYCSANSACVLSCASEGWVGEMCFDCVQKSVFPGNKSNGATCPRCERVVLGYSYAFFAFYRNRSSMQDRLAALDAEVRDLKKQLAAAEAGEEDAAQTMEVTKPAGGDTSMMYMAMAAATLLGALVGILETKVLKVIVRG